MGPCTRFGYRPHVHVKILVRESIKIFFFLKCTDTDPCTGCRPHGQVGFSLWAIMRIFFVFLNVQTWTPAFSSTEMQVPWPSSGLVYLKSNVGSRTFREKMVEVVVVVTEVLVVVVGI